MPVVWEEKIQGAFLSRLGARFLDEIEQSFDRIALDPYLYGMSIARIFARSLGNRFSTIT
ncbi:MAG TPA: hypothetical protein PK667_12650 [Nitrosomonas europaea]|uniref:hypothetical protein n=1 Tax=Nitrosomonas TaxID=914 RepID=UPI0002D6D2C2|nr:MULTISPECIES: hypothetical protein [Nitrosomonas]HBF25458.1 hypothetical protein [Nitrosomonas sp.]HRO57433.1 hypothetical protein [Nitrosomonas europaea]HUM75020.1 hypothetical protein [Nitrosomonas europaea]